MTPIRKKKNDTNVESSLLSCQIIKTIRSNELGWERLKYVRLKQLAVSMYKIHNNLSPSYLGRIFTNTSNVHSHNLRNSDLNYYVPRSRIESAKGSLHYRGVCSVEQDSLRD